MAGFFGFESPLPLTKSIAELRLKKWVQRDGRGAVIIVGKLPVFNKKEVVEGNYLKNIYMIWVLMSTYKYQLIV